MDTLENSLVPIMQVSILPVTVNSPPPRDDCRATNFFRQNPHPGDSFSLQHSGPRVGKNKTKSPTPWHKLPSSNAKYQ